jgi:O-antigen ligase
VTTASATRGPSAATQDADRSWVPLAAGEITLAVTIVAGVAVSYAFPFRAAKYALIVLFLVALIGQTQRRPALGLALVAFSIPAMDLVPPQMYGGIRALNTETVLIVVALGIWARTVAMYGRDRLATPLGRLLLAWVILILFSAVRTWMLWKVPLLDILAAAKNHLAFMIFLPVAFHVLRERRDQVLLLLAISVSLFLNALQGINHSWLAFAAGSLERHRAMALLALQPNIYGTALAVYLPFCLVLTLHRVAGPWIRLWFATVTAAVSFALLLTLSRGAWLGAIMAVSVVALVRNRALLFVLALGLIGYQAWLPEQAVKRIEVTTEVDDDAEAGDAIAEGSTQMRIEQYKSLPAMMADHPLLGWGYRSFPTVFEQHGTLGRAKGAHSSYVQVATEEGIVGLVLLVTILFACAWAGVRASRTDDPFVQWMGISLLGATVALAVCMASGARFELQKILGWFWILAGFVEREGLLARMRLDQRFGASQLAPASGAPAADQ